MSPQALIIFRQQGRDVIYFRTNDIPELEQWSRDQIHEAWYAEFKNMHHLALPWIGYLISLLIPAVILYGFHKFPEVLLVFPGFLIGTFVMSQFQLRAAKPLMLRWLEVRYPHGAVYV